MMSTDITISIVGAGSMGGAIASGLAASGMVDARNISAYDPSPAALQALRDKDMTVYASLDGLAEAGSQVFLLAVKPQVLPQVLAEVAPLLPEGQLVVSIAAGVKLATIEAALPTAHVVRVMPNLPLQVLSGASAVSAGTKATAEEVELVRSLFAALGSAQVLTEAQLDVAGAVTGCGPAFFALFVDDLTRVGVRAGLPAKACRELVLATMRGVAMQLQEGGEHPRAYMEKVTSPGGTTAAALEAMEGDMFYACCDAIDAALARTKELAGD